MNYVTATIHDRKVLTESGVLTKMLLCFLVKETAFSVKKKYKKLKHESRKMRHIDDHEFIECKMNKTDMTVLSKIDHHFFDAISNQQSQDNGCGQPPELKGMYFLK